MQLLALLRIPSEASYSLLARAIRSHTATCEYLPKLHTTCCAYLPKLHTAWCLHYGAAKAFGSSFSIIWLKAFSSFSFGLLSAHFEFDNTTTSFYMVIGLNFEAVENINRQPTLLSSNVTFRHLDVTPIFFLNLL